MVGGTLEVETSKSQLLCFVFNLLMLHCFINHNNILNAFFLPKTIFYLTLLKKT